eukprot:EG_transcript_6616
MAESARLVSLPGRAVRWRWHESLTFGIVVLALLALCWEPPRWTNSWHLPSPTAAAAPVQRLMNPPPRHYSVGRPLLRPLGSAGPAGDPAPIGGPGQMESPWPPWLEGPAALLGQGLHWLWPLLLAAVVAVCCWPRRPALCMAAAGGATGGGARATRAPRKAPPPPEDFAKQLAEANRHPRDQTVRKDPKKRTWEYFSPNGKWVKASTSVTSFVYSLFPVFEEDKVIDSMMMSPTWPPEKYVNPETQQPYTRREIKQLWRDKSKDSITRGTYMHLNIEKALNGAPADVALPELQQFQTLQLEVFEQRGIQPVRTEMSIYDEDLDLAGVVDFLGQDPSGAFHLCEWKRAVDYEKKAAEVFKATASALWPVEHLPNNDAVKHALQLNLYARILEQKYGVRVAGLWIGVMHADRSAPLAAQVPFLQRELDCLLALRRLDVLAAWRAGKETVSLAHEDSLNLLKEREEPIVATFQAALDAMKAANPQFYGATDDKQRYAAVVGKARSLLRLHAPAGAVLAEDDEPGPEEVVEEGAEAGLEVDVHLP